MDWSSIVYGVLGGGAGVAIGLLLGAGVQKLRSSQIEEDEYDRFDTGLSGVLAGGLAFAGIMLLPSFYKDMMLPRIMPMDTSQHFASMPIYETLKHQSPDDFRKEACGCRCYTEFGICKPAADGCFQSKST